MSDQHAEDLMALVTELSELEFRRGVLHARIEWHVRLRDLAGTAAARAPRPAPPAARRPRGTLQAAVLAALATSSPMTCAQVAAAVEAGSVESVRQVLISLVARKRLTKTGGRYAMAESHAGAGLVAVG